MAYRKLNDSIRVIFEHVLPSLTNTGIKYWVYGGIGIAGAVGEPVRSNGDVDIYVLNEDFSKAERVLRRLCEEHNVSNNMDCWEIKPRRPLRTGRPKLDFLIGRRERLSVVPIYNTDNGVEFRVNKVFPLPNEALVQELRTVEGYEFYSPPREIIEKLLCIMIEKEIGSYKGEKPVGEALKGKRMIDAKAIFSTEEYEQIVKRLREKEKKTYQERGEVG